jgi:hypothetical protein
MDSPTGEPPERLSRLPTMTEDTGRYVCIAALFVAGLLGAWVAWACRQAQRRGLSGYDAPVWAGLALVYLLFSQTRAARAMGWLRGWGQWLRQLAREHQLYAHRRPLQIAATVAVAVAVIALMAIGLAWAWHHIRRYRLAVGFAALAVGYAVIRFISLHEVDAWNAALPWARVAVELTAAAGASAVAVGRLAQLGEFARLRRHLR